MADRALCYFIFCFRGLGLNSNEEILGFLYIGTPMKADRPMKVVKKDDFFKYWPAKV